MADSRFANARAEEVRIATQKSLVKDVASRQLEAAWISKNEEVVHRVSERERCVHTRLATRTLLCADRVTAPNGVGKRPRRLPRTRSSRPGARGALAAGVVGLTCC